MRVKNESVELHRQVKNQASDIEVLKLQVKNQAAQIEMLKSRFEMFDEKR